MLVLNNKCKLQRDGIEKTEAVNLLIWNVSKRLKPKETTSQTRTARFWYSFQDETRENRTKFVLTY